MSKDELQAVVGAVRYSCTEDREYRARHTAGNEVGSYMGEAARNEAQHHGAKRKKVTRSLKSRKIPHDKKDTKKLRIAKTPYLV